MTSDRDHSSEAAESPATAAHFGAAIRALKNDFETMHNREQVKAVLDSLTAIYGIDVPAAAVATEITDPEMRKTIFMGTDAAIVWLQDLLRALKEEVESDKLPGLYLVKGEYDG